MRDLKPSEVEFTLEVQQDDIPLEGNVLACGDAEEDKRAEEEVRERLDNGDVWAWALVTVSATITLPDGTKIRGWDSLGACNYANEADFKRCGYYGSMEMLALDDLKQKIEAKIKTGEILAHMFAEGGANDVR